MYQFRNTITGILISLIGTLALISNLSAEELVFEEIEWIALMPKDDLNALLDPPEFLLNIEDGGEQDNLDTLAVKGQTDEKAKRFQAALKSQRVIDSFAGRNIKLPGFIVPLKTNDKREVTEFFIVPYFGACLHLPPPPPNQIIFGTWPDGVVVDDLSAPMWFEGTVKIETSTNSLGTSAYALTLNAVMPY